MRTVVAAGSTLNVSTIPAGVLLALGVLLLLEVVLAAIALVDLYRRPLDRVALGNKWVWVAIIVLVNILGPILYFVLGRKAGAAGEEPGVDGAPGHSQVDIGEALYGPRDDSTTP